MSKEKIVFIIGIIATVIGSCISVYATSYLYNSNEVSYDHSSSGLSADNVQGAIDELYASANQYSDFNDRVTALESHFKNDPTGDFSGGWIRANSTGNDRGFQLFDSGTQKGSLYYSQTSDTVFLQAMNSSGTWGKGKINIVGDPVQINGIDVGNLIKYKSFTVPCTTLTKGMNLSSYVSLDSGYKFLAYQVMATSNGWTTDRPIYCSNVSSSSCVPYWNGTHSCTSSSNTIGFHYFEIKS